MVLPRRDPFDAAALLGWLAARAVPGVEAVTGTTYARSLRLTHGDGVVAVPLDGGPLRCDVVARRRARPRRGAGRDRAPARPRAPTPRRSARTRAPTRCWRRWSTAHPGLRCPGAVDGAELAVRAVLGQQVSLAAAGTLAARITAALGRPLRAPRAGGHAPLRHRRRAAGRRPRGARDAALARARAARAGRRAGRRRLALAPGADPAGHARGPAGAAGHRAVDGRLRAHARAGRSATSSWPTDLGVRHALARLPGGDRSRPGAWAPWRSYATQHLWQALADGA